MKSYLGIPVIIGAKISYRPPSEEWTNWHDFKLPVKRVSISEGVNEEGTSCDINFASDRSVFNYIDTNQITEGTQFRVVLTQNREATFKRFFGFLMDISDITLERARKIITIRLNSSMELLKRCYSPNKELGQMNAGGFESLLEEVTFWSIPGEKVIEFSYSVDRGWDKEIRFRSHNPESSITSRILETLNDESQRRATAHKCYYYINAATLNSYEETTDPDAFFPRLRMWYRFLEGYEDMTPNFTLSTTDFYSVSIVKEEFKGSAIRAKDTGRIHRLPNVEKRVGIGHLSSDTWNEGVETFLKPLWTKHKLIATTRKPMVYSLGTLFYLDFWHIGFQGTGVLVKVETNVETGSFSQKLTFNIEDRNLLEVMRLWLKQER